MDKKEKKKGGFLKKLIIGVVAVFAIFFIIGCFIDDDEENTASTEPDYDEESVEGSWAIYWYLCGSDLESNGGYATTDLEEMMSVELPENVQVVIQTGGCGDWQNESISADEIGWCYDGWVGELAADTTLSPKNLGKAICDTYYSACEDYGMEDDVTLSVTDLSKISKVLKAYNLYGTEALCCAATDDTFLAQYARAASNTENYGGNTDKSGYTDMADLGDLAANSKELLPDTTNALLNAIDSAVVYQVKGPYRDRATGLSCFYSYSGDCDMYDKYSKVAGSKAFNYLYAYEFTGCLDDDAYNCILEYTNTYLEAKSIPKKGQIKKAEVDASTLEDHEVTISDENYGVLNLGKEIAALISEVNYQLAIMEDDILVYLGSDNDVDCDWENGVFTENFHGMWGGIDDHLVYMEVIGSNEDYTTFSVPIKLNGEYYNLRVVYDYNDEEFKILGALKSAEDDGRTEKGLRKLKVGDEITTLHYAVNLAEDDAEAFEFEMDTFKVTKDTKFAETELGDGHFCLLFEMIDADKNDYTSEAVLFTVEDGNMSYDD